MWLFNSSIGRKVVMSVTGIALILFLTFHCCIAALAVIHIVYAFILTAQNRTARGNSRYDVATTVNAGKVEWASKNMLVLGLIICLGLLLHLLLMASGVLCRPLVGVVRRGSAVGRLLVASMSHCSCWASS